MEEKNNEVYILSIRLKDGILPEAIIEVFDSLYTATEYCKSHSYDNPEKYSYQIYRRILHESEISGITEKQLDYYKSLEGKYFAAIDTKYNNSECECVFKCPKIIGERLFEVEGLILSLDEVFLSEYQLSLQRFQRLREDLFPEVIEIFDNVKYVEITEEEYNYWIDRVKQSDKIRKDICSGLEKFKCK